MGKLLLVRPGSGSPDLLSLEAWQALSGRLIAHTPDDPLGLRLREAGLPVREIELEMPPPATSAGPAELRLIAHAHDHESPHLSALAERLVALAAEHDELAFIVPDDGEAVVRAVLSRAMKGDVEVEIVIGRAPRGHRLLDLVRVMARLRGPGGCPWDAEQTHATLAKYLLDETYELLEAIESGSEQDIAEELGDLLLQVVFHAQMGADAGTFDVDDAADALVQKLIRRHPHVFGDVTVSGAEEVVANWDEIKHAEKDRASVVEGVPESLPALAYAAKLLRRSGVEDKGSLDRVRAGLDALIEGAEDSFGHVLFGLVALSRGLGVDAETALRRSARRFRDRLVAVETAARERGSSLRDLPAGELAALWTDGGVR